MIFSPDAVQISIGVLQFLVMIGTGAVVVILLRREVGSLLKDRDTDRVSLGVMREAIVRIKSDVRDISTRMEIAGYGKPTERK